ncbi:MAG: type II toxin-antitoxin system RelE/ParE family toxin [Proteobacteria bacterium]|nr:type II toxin-antitoxin system RelE/ParE family toxin [Pseudomonadota bacterium]
MKYRLVYTHRAFRDIQELEENVKKRIGKVLERYREEPLKFASRLIDSKLGMFRFRIGDYRVICDIEDNEIIILRVGHRKDIYRKL